MPFSPLSPLWCLLAARHKTGDAYRWDPGFELAGASDSRVACKSGRKNRGQAKHCKKKYTYPSTLSHA